MYCGTVNILISTDRPRSERISVVFMVALINGRVNAIAILVKWDVMYGVGVIILWICSIIDRILYSVSRSLIDVVDVGYSK